MIINEDLKIADVINKLTDKKIKVDQIPYVLFRLQEECTRLLREVEYKEQRLALYGSLQNGEAI